MLYPPVALERAMTIREVVLRAMSGDALPEVRGDGTAAMIGMPETNGCRSCPS